MTEPVTLAEAKSFLRYTGTGDAALDAGDDADITALIQAARELVEHHTERSLPAQILQHRMRCFPPAREYIELPRPPARAITSVSYVDDDGDTQVWDAANYTLSTQHTPARLYRVYDGDWPSTRDQANAVIITYSAGYATSVAVPAILKTAIKWSVKDWFDVREPTNIGGSVNILPNRTQDILRSWRTFRVFSEKEESIAVSGEPSTTPTGGYYYIPSLTALTGGGATALDGLDPDIYPNGSIIKTYISGVPAEWHAQARAGESEGSGIIIMDGDSTRIWLQIA